jgi:hypothetical protein
MGHGPNYPNSLAPKPGDYERMYTQAEYDVAILEARRDEADWWEDEFVINNSVSELQISLAVNRRLDLERKIAERNSDRAD